MSHRKKEGQFIISRCPSQLPRTLLEQVDRWQGFQASEHDYVPHRYTWTLSSLTFWYTLQVQVHPEKSLKLDANWCCFDSAGADMMFRVPLVLNWQSVSGWYNVIGCWADALSTNLQTCVLPAGGCSAAEGQFPQRWGLRHVVRRWPRAVQDLQFKLDF